GHAQRPCWSQLALHIQWVGEVLWPLALKDLADQFADLAACLGEGCPSRVRDRVVLADLAVDDTIFTRKVPGGLQAVEDWVERARAEFIPMPPQLLDHRQPVDRLLVCVMQNVDLDEAQEELTEHAISYRYRSPIMNDRR